MQILHELLKEAMDGRLLMDGRLAGHPGSSWLRVGPGPSVTGRRPGADLGCGS
jgi:hypothetical protein